MIIFRSLLTPFEATTFFFQKLGQDLFTNLKTHFLGLDCIDDKQPWNQGTISFAENKFKHQSQKGDQKEQC